MLPSPELLLVFLFVTVVDVAVFLEFNAIVTVLVVIIDSSLLV